MTRPRPALIADRDEVFAAIAQAGLELDEDVDVARLLTRLRAVLADADAVWFGGGRQWRLADAYLASGTIGAARLAEKDD